MYQDQLNQHLPAMRGVMLREYPQNPDELLPGGDTSSSDAIRLANGFCQPVGFQLNATVCYANAACGPCTCAPGSAMGKVKRALLWELCWRNSGSAPQFILQPRQREDADAKERAPNNFIELRPLPSGEGGTNCSLSRRERVGVRGKKLNLFSAALKS